MKKIPRALTLRVFAIVTFVLMGLGVAQNCFQWPVSGPITSNTGWRWGRMHNGLDIGVPIGTTVYAPADGTVRTYSDFVYGSGNVLEITHANGSKTVFLHLSGYFVTSGVVRQGQPIARTGNTAFTNRPGDPHLHFEVRDANGNRVAQANGTSWDRAAGVSSTSQGQCIPNLAAAGVTPGGAVAGAPPPGNTPTTPGQTPTTPGQTPTTPPITPGEVPPISEPYDLSKIDLEKLLPTAEKWLQETNDIMESFGLGGYLNNLGIALLFACFVYSIVNANYFYRTDQYLSLFGRFIIAAGLVLGSSAIGTSVMNMWKGTYKTMQTRVVAPATTELETALNQLGPQLKNLALTTAAMNTLAAVIPEIAGIDVGEEVVKNFAELGGQSIKGLFIVMVLMGSIYGIYFLTIYVSGMIALLAGVLLPVLAPFLVVPGSSSWFTRWFSMVFLSLVTIVAMPFLLHVVVKLGVTAPMVEVNGIATQMQQQADALKAQADNYPKGMPNMINPLAWGDYMLKMGVVAGQVSVNMTKLYIQWGFALVILAMAILASIYLLQQLPRLLQGFIGGAFGAAASPVSGGVLGGMLAQGALGAGSAAGAAGKLGGAAASKAGGLAVTGAAVAGSAAAGGIRKGVEAIKNMSSSSSSPRGNQQAALPPSGGSSASKGTSGNNLQSSGSGGSPSRASASASGSSGSTSRLSTEESRSLNNDPNVINVKSR